MPGFDYDSGRSGGVLSCKPVWPTHLGGEPCEAKVDQANTHATTHRPNHQKPKVTKMVVPKV